MKRSTTIPQHDQSAYWKGLYGGVVCVLTSLYYAIFFFPPRLVGSNEPDRYFHLGLARLISTDGLPKILPQVEDLGWGHYFPDKEFLFHALTGAAYWLAGPAGVLLVVPLLGIAIVACLYTIVARVLPPGRAAALVLTASLLSPVQLFRLSLLRPHLLAILFFCLLLAAILRGRGWLAALASAGFALSYHAFYIPMLVIGVASVIRWPEESDGARRWPWAVAGLVLGIVLNPYFPSTLVMSWLHVKLALGIGLPPGLRSGEELQPLSTREFLHYFGFLPVALVGTGTLIVVKRLWPGRATASLWFLFLLSGLLTLLSVKSMRATEYAVPSIIVLVAYALSLLRGVRWIWLTCLLIAISQGHASWLYYQDSWSQPQGGDSPSYLAAISLLPLEADGQKVFNCQWETGSYMLFARPRIRFVDLLEPAMLWQASPAKYIARQRLIWGADSDPWKTLREQFKADYVLCGTPGLNKQMAADPLHFQQITGTEPMNSLRVYRIRN